MHYYGRHHFSPRQNSPYIPETGHGQYVLCSRRYRRTGVELFLFVVNNSSAD